MKYGLDLASGLDLWTDELFGDWYRDPWSWPELDWAKRSRSKLDVGQYVASSKGSISLMNAPKFHSMEIPKSRLGVRPAVVQDPVSRLVYLAAVSSVILKLHESLADFVYGWRSRGLVRPSGNAAEWKSYIEWVRGGKDFPAGLQTDVTSCFASINTARIVEEVTQRVGKSGPVHIISQVLNAHDGVNGRSGLPQRSFGSAVLANFYLVPIDELLLRARRSPGVGVVARWMDDIVCFGSDATLYSLFLDIQQEMRTLGLEANSSKSVLVTSADAVEAIDLEEGRSLKVRMEPGAASGQRGGVPNVQDVERIKRVEAKILETGGKEGRPALKKILVSLREAKLFDRWQDWVSIAHELPHVADSVGRYLRAAARSADHEGLTWGYLDEWLAEFFSKEWARVHWVKAQLALSMPTEDAGPNILGIMENWLESGSELQLLAVAAQRLAARKPELCRSIISGRAGSISDPLIQRVLGLAVLMTKGNRALAQSLIRQDPANSLLATALDDENWVSPPIGKDFEYGTDS